MKIAILGTRGIPNNYGGFEQLAQFLSIGLQQNGHQIFVYSSSRHSYQENEWKGIHIIHQRDPEGKIGTIGQFIYDLNCIIDSRKRGFDVILNLGYTSSSVWMDFFSTRTRIITNMDGLEWKRSKYSKNVQRFLKFAEKLAVKKSHALIADSLAIQQYLTEKYAVESQFIAYGANVFENSNERVLDQFNARPFEYDMLIARMEPENNIEVILDGAVENASSRQFFVVGNTENRFGTYLKEKYKNVTHIKFMGPIYDTEVIDNLRFFANLYFHGHSVGGTNPSLLEAMGCHSLICAHDNVFNRSVLGDNAFYFSNANDVSARLAATKIISEKRASFISENLLKIRTNYSWDVIVRKYEDMMTDEFLKIQN